MLRKQRDEEAVLATHGRWIAKLRDTTRMAEQRLRILEQHISAFESQLAELAKIQRKLDVQHAALDARLTRLDASSSGRRRRR